MDTNNKIKKSLRTLAIGTAATVAGLGVVGAGTATAAEGPSSAVETESAATAGYEIAPVGIVLVKDPFGLEYQYNVTGGQINADRTGEITLSNGDSIEIENAVVFGEFLALTVTYTDVFGMTVRYEGILDQVVPGALVYEGELENEVFGAEMLFELPGLMLTPR